MITLGDNKFFSTSFSITIIYLKWEAIRYDEKDPEASIQVLALVTASYVVLGKSHER